MKKLSGKTEKGTGYYPAGYPVPDIYPAGSGYIRKTAISGTGYPVTGFFVNFVAVFFVVFWSPSKQTFWQT